MPNVALRTDPRWIAYLSSKEKERRMRNSGIPRININNDLIVNNYDDDDLFRRLNGDGNRNRRRQDDEDDDGNKNENMGDIRERTAVNVSASFILAIGFTLLIIAGLAVNTDTIDRLMLADANFGNGNDDVVGIMYPNESILLAEEIGEKVLTSALPDSLPGILSIGLGEGLAGFLGALAVYLAQITSSLNGKNASSSTLLNNRKNMANDSVKTVRNDDKNEVLASTEYFFVRSITQPLLAASGLPVELVSLFSVLVASLNSQLIKFGSIQIVDAVVKEGGEGKNSAIDGVTLSEASNKPKKFDVVEVFADIVKWLEYDVLKSDLFSDVQIKTPIVSGVLSEETCEGLAFGALATLSSSLYADILYRFTFFGDPTAKAASFNRSNKERIARYFTKSATGASIFGVYEGAREPLSRIILEFLSGGVDGCVGSSDFDICMETYMLLNEPGATPEAQFRSFAAAAYGVLDRIGLLSIGDTNIADQVMNTVRPGYVETARGAIVTLYSILHTNAPFLEDFLTQFSLF